MRQGSGIIYQWTLLIRSTNIKCQLHVKQLIEASECKQQVTRKFSNNQVNKELLIKKSLKTLRNSI